MIVAGILCVCRWVSVCLCEGFCVFVGGGHEDMESESIKIGKKIRDSLLLSQMQ